MFQRAVQVLRFWDPGSSGPLPVPNLVSQDHVQCIQGPVPAPQKYLQQLPSGFRFKAFGLSIILLGSQYSVPQRVQVPNI